MQSPFTEWLIKRWTIPEIAPHDPTVIAALDYGTAGTPDSPLLARATAHSLGLAIVHAQRHPQAYLAFGDSNHCFPGSDTFEHREKTDLIHWANIDERRVIATGAIWSSVTEAWRARDALRERGIYLREILVICDPLHGRSTLFIWQKVFGPEVKISLQYIGETAAQGDHAFPDQHTVDMWLYSNIIRQIALRLVGLRLVANIKHTAK